MPSTRKKGESPEERRSSQARLFHARLIKAIRVSDAKEVASAVADGADPNAKGENGKLPLCAAAYLLSEEALRELLRSGADPNLAEERGQTPLHWLARSMHGGEGPNEKRGVSMARDLLRAGADPNALDNWGWGPLAVALRWKRKELALELIAAGAKASALDVLGRPIGQIARECGLEDERRIAEAFASAEAMREEIAPAQPGKRALRKI